jgi:lipopolysaccharide cholinephosphotransferase
MHKKIYMIYGEELKLVQTIEVDILKEIIRVCSKRDIEYFIVGGTALGAVRHGGFIPWDDDIDIGMTRENYNKFLDIANDELSEGFFLQTVFTDAESPFHFAKVRKNGTKFIEYYCRDLNIHQGVFVDVFPYDNIPDDPHLKKKQYIKTAILSNLFVSKTVKELSIEVASKKDYIKNISRYSLYYLLKPIPKKTLYKMLEKEIQKYNSIETSSRCYVKTPALLIKNEFLYPIKNMKFEDIMVSAPSDCHSYLSSQYGDYMKLPPEEKRHGHKPYILEV